MATGSAEMSVFLLTFIALGYCSMRIVDHVLTVESVDDVIIRSSSLSTVIDNNSPLDHLKSFSWRLLHICDLICTF